jgi:hypothetical protein
MVKLRIDKKSLRKLDRSSEGKGPDISTENSKATRIGASIFVSASVGIRHEQAKFLLDRNFHA